MGSVSFKVCLSFITVRCKGVFGFVWTGKPFSIPSSSERLKRRDQSNRGTGPRTPGGPTARNQQSVSSTKQKCLKTLHAAHPSTTRVVSRVAKERRNCSSRKVLKRKMELARGGGTEKRDFPAPTLTQEQCSYIKETNSPARIVKSGGAG